MNPTSEAIFESFQTLIELLRPSDDDLRIYAGLMTNLERILIEICSDGFAVKIGSFKRFTAIRNSDMDFIFIVPRELLARSNGLVPSDEFLNWLAAQIRLHLPTSKVRVSPPAIVVKDQNGAFEINLVPGGSVKFPYLGSSVRAAVIADGKNGWKYTVPKLYDDFLDEANIDTHKILNHVARVFKFWRNTRSRPLRLQSFYVEIVLAMSGVCKCGSYSEAVWRGFSVLHGSAISGCEDPLGLPGRLLPCDSDPEILRLESALRSSSGYATQAIIAENDGDLQGARACWNKVFNGYFPEFRTKREDLGWGRSRLTEYPGTSISIPDIFL